MGNCFKKLYHRVLKENSLVPFVSWRETKLIIETHEVVSLMVLKIIPQRSLSTQRKQFSVVCGLVGNKIYN